MDLQNIQITSDQLDSLYKRFGKELADQMIEELDERLPNIRRKYKSHYHVVLVYARNKWFACQKGRQEAKAHIHICVWCDEEHPFTHPDCPDRCVLGADCCPVALEKLTLAVERLRAESIKIFEYERRKR